MTDATKVSMARELRFHYIQVWDRLLFTAIELDAAVVRLASFYDGPPNPPPIEVMATKLQAETRADHLLTYLGSAVDDVALLMAMAFNYIASSPQRRIDSMGKLRRGDIRTDQALAPLASIIQHTDEPASWWMRGFETKRGARQLLIHNQHVVSFQLSAMPGGKTEARGLVSTGVQLPQQVPFNDFFWLLRDVISDLFDWLDEAEIILADHLKSLQPSWKPDPRVPARFIPIGLPSGETTLSKEYCALPLCDDSEPLPWTIWIPK